MTIFLSKEGQTKNMKNHLFYFYKLFQNNAHFITVWINKEGKNPGTRANVKDHCSQSNTKPCFISIFLCWNQCLVYD